MVSSHNCHLGHGLLGLSSTSAWVVISIDNFSQKHIAEVLVHFSTWSAMIPCIREKLGMKWWWSYFIHKLNFLCRVHDRYTQTHHSITCQPWLQNCLLCHHWTSQQDNLAGIYTCNNSNSFDYQKHNSSCNQSKVIVLGYKKCFLYLGIMISLYWNYLGDTNFQQNGSYPRPPTLPPHTALAHVATTTTDLASK